MRCFQTILVLGTLLIPFGCAEQSRPADAAIMDLNPPEGWVEYSLSSPVISILAPASWELDTSNQMGTDLIVLSPPDSADDFFRENVTITSEDVSELDMDLDAYVAAASEALQNYITDLEGFTVEKQGADYWFSYSGRQGAFRLNYLQRVVMEDPMAYIITYTSMSSNPSEHDRLGRMTLEGFRVRNEP